MNNVLNDLKTLVSNIEVEADWGEYKKVMNAHKRVEKALKKAQELEKENAELNQHIKRWHDLLLKTGINSKGTVVDEIENYWTIKAEK